VSQYPKNHVIVDVGGVSGPGTRAIDRTEAGSRAGFILRTMARMGYEAVGVGPTDQRLGDEYFAEAERAGLPVLASMGGYAEKHPKAIKTLVKQFGRHKVGFAALPKPQAVRLRADDLVPVLKQLRRRCGTVILLSELGHRDDQRLVKLPGMRGLVDVVIGNASASAAPPLERQQGTPVFVRNNGKGGHVFLLTVRTGWFARPRYAVQDFMLAPEMAEDPAVRRAVDEYHRQSEKRFLAASAQLMPPPAELPVISSSACAQCHPQEYKLWAQSGHARAVATLRQDRKRVPDCLPCHSEFFRQERVFVDTKRDPQGVECVSCHGSAGQHAKDPTKHGMIRGEGEAICTECHTQGNSPKFNYETYRERIKHWRE